MVNYKDLGLVNTKEMFAKAIKGGYAIPAFNFNNMEQMQAIIKAAVETKSPVILQVSKGARQYANATLLRYMAQGAVEYAKELGCPNPQIVLHLDHGDTFETCKSCIDQLRLTSVERVRSVRDLDLYQRISYAVDLDRLFSVNSRTSDEYIIV